MATAADGITSAVSVQCAICLDELHVPKALPCLHTFCLTCLQRHIGATVRTKGDKLVCPECRKKCCPPHPRRPVGEWASQFPTNFHLQNLIEASRGCSGEGRDQGRNTDGFARHLKEYRTFVDSRLIDLGTEQQGVSAMRSRVTDTWTQSKERLQEVFARVVSAVKAREQELVQELDEDYVDNTQRLFDKEDQIASKMKQLRHCSDVITNVMTCDGDAMTQGLANIEREVSQMRRDVAEEEKPKEQTCTSFVANSDEVGKILSCVSELGTIRSELLGRQCQESASAIQLASSLSRLSLTDKQNESQQRATSLERDCLLSTPAESESPGSMSAVENASRPTMSQPQFMTRYNLTYKGDKKEPFITGVCWVAGYILLTDVNNRSVKSLYFPRKDGAVLKADDLILRSDPLCVTALKTAHVVVGSERCLYVLRVKDKAKLMIQDIVHTSKCYYGIVALSDGRSVAACSDQPPSVDVVNLHTGQITKSIMKNPAGGGPLFTSPFYLAALPRERLVVSDKDNSAHPLVCISVEGDVIYRYATSDHSHAGSEQLTWPLGISSCWEDCVLVVDATQHAVFRMSPDGRTVTKVLEDASRLRSPSALCFDGKTGNLYVVGNKGQLLLVYNFA